MMDPQPNDPISSIRRPQTGHQGHARQLCNKAGMRRWHNAVRMPVSFGHRF
jgi:hypothetical protein